MAAAASSSQPKSLPKVDKPTPFDGTVDTVLIDNFLYQCELYFGVMNIVNDVAKASFAVLLLKGNAAVWVRSNYTMGQL